jgi:nucleotide-binding universal stress UspA family protein
MTMTGSEMKSRVRKASPTTRPSTAATRLPTRILAVVDGTEQTNRVVEYLASLAASGGAIEVVAINVQTKREDRLRGYESFKQHEIDDRLINDLGMPIVSGVSRRLEKAGIPTQIRIDIGDPIDTILRRSTQEHSDAIVIGEPKPGALRRWFARTLGVVSGTAAMLSALSKVPVIVVK